MFKKRNISTLTIALFFTHFLYGQIDSLFYDIKITVKGLTTPKTYLGYYFADETYIVDSAKVDTLTGFMRFSRRRRLPEGMYFIAHSIQADTFHKTDKEGIIMDFVVNGWKDFSIKTHINSPIDSAEIIRSDENQAYFDYSKTFYKLKKDIFNLEKNTLDHNNISDDDLKLYYRKLKTLDNLTPFYIKKYPQTLWSKVLQVRQPYQHVQPRHTSQAVASIAPPEVMNEVVFSFNRKYYWENFDFRDTRILRSRVYITRLKQYVQEVIPPHIDSVKQYCDILLAHTKVSLEYYQATLKWLTQYYESKLDDSVAQSVFEHLVKNYHHRTSSGTSALVLQILDKKLASLKHKRVGGTPSVSDD